MRIPEQNADAATVASFGNEWTTFDQQGLPEEELRQTFEAYFRIFPWELVDERSTGFDLGCGSGRWARFVAPRVGVLDCVDASAAALEVARRTLSEHENCRFHHASVDNLPFSTDSMDFGYALGVLHHVPNTAAGLRSCSELLRPGAPFLVYLYYALDGRPRWYRALWRSSDLLRRFVSRLPHRAKLGVSAMVAGVVYWPLARTARAAERVGLGSSAIPLAFYRDRSFYTMRTDAYDRLGTRLERRFSAEEIRSMMQAAGLTDIRMSPDPPFWCAVGIRR